MAADGNALSRFNVLVSAVIETRSHVGRSDPARLDGCKVV